jgi:fibronectin-binding autotransporter adhesin
VIVQNNAATPLTVSSAIANNGTAMGLTKSGPGTLILNGANTYSGTTTIDGGTLQMGNALALGASGSGLALNGGTLDLNGQNPTVGKFSGTSGLVTNNSAASTSTLTVYFASGNSTFSGSIADGAGKVALSITGGGTVVLTGGNAFTGDTTIAGGGIWIKDTNSLQNSTVNLLSGGGLTFDASVSSRNYTLGALSGTANQNLKQSNNNPILLTVGGNNSTTTYSGVLTGVNLSSVLTKTGNGMLTLTGNNNMGSGSKVVISGGTLQVGNGGTGEGLSCAWISDSRALIFNHADPLTIAASITGAGSVTKYGSGMLTLSGANKYTGATTIDAGTLAVSSSLGATAVAVNANGTLCGSGTLTGAVTLYG